MRVIKWADLEVTNLSHIPVKIDTESVGFLEVFNTIEELLEAYPNEVHYQEVKMTEIH